MKIASTGSLKHLNQVRKQLWRAAPFPAYTELSRPQPNYSFSVLQWELKTLLKKSKDQSWILVFFWLMSPHLFSFLSSFKCQSLLLNQLSFCPLFCGILWCIMFPGHGMWWKVGSGWIQMAEIFTHSKVTVSSKSHPKQISAQMPRLAGLGHSFLMQWQRHFICLELNHHCYSITVTLIGQTLWSRDSIKHEHISQNLIRNFRSLGYIYWMQKLTEGMGFF